MACGLPSVACRVGGVTDLITDGVNGRLVEPGSPKALEEAIVALRTDGATAARWADAARRTMEARYSLDVLAEEHRGFLTALVRGGRLDRWMDRGVDERIDQSSFEINPEPVDARV
jgi:glycosyltransferase involved in cell wall biosynthesis